MELENLLNLIKDYSYEDKSMILHAYEFASIVHQGVKRKSGDDYIKHPLAVAIILGNMHADADTICAGLLHDVIEDGENITKEQLSEHFNPTIATLVDGVTKIKKMGEDKEKVDAANMRKIIESITHDIRIFVIKLADRLHNMRTLEFHKVEKQKEISHETQELYVPFANLIGEYKIQLELEDLSFKYLSPRAYQNAKATLTNAEKVYRRIIDRMLTSLAQELNTSKINYEIKTNLKNIYGAYKSLKTFKKMEYIHDVATITILVDDVDKCYELDEQLKEMFVVVPSKCRDYIKQPKTNMYQSLQVTVQIGRRYIQFQVTTPEMYRVNQYGLAAYWKILNENPAAKMQDDVRKFQFYSLLSELSTLNLSNDVYNREVREALLSQLIYVYTPKGDVIELADGSTPVDFAYKIHTEIGDSLVSATVNGELVPLNTKLKSDDIVEVYHDPHIIGPRQDYYDMCHNESTKRKIRELRKK